MIDQPASPTVAAPRVPLPPPARAPWREGALTRAGELRGRLAEMLAVGEEQRGAQALADEIGAHITAAEQAALGHDDAPNKLLHWFQYIAASVQGAAVERAQSHLDAAEAGLLRLAPPSYVLGQLPALLARIRAFLPEDDPRLLRAVRLANRYAARTSGAAAIDAVDREAIVAALRAATIEERRQVARVRSFRNVLLSAALALTVCAAGVLVVGMVEPRALPLCFTPGQSVVCPTHAMNVDHGGTANAGTDQLPQTASVVADLDDDMRDAVSSWDIAVIELVGLVAAALAGAAALRKAEGTSTPYGLPAALAVVKLPSGALTAVLGILLIRGAFIPGLTSLDTSGQIIAWAVIFGYAQQVFTRFVDERARGVLDAVGTVDKTKSAGLAGPAPRHAPGPAGRRQPPARLRGAGGRRRRRRAEPRGPPRALAALERDGGRHAGARDLQRQRLGVAQRPAGLAGEAQLDRGRAGLGGLAAAARDDLALAGGGELQRRAGLDAGDLGGEAGLQRLGDRDLARQRDLGAVVGAGGGGDRHLDGRGRDHAGAVDGLAVAVDDVGGVGVDRVGAPAAADGVDLAVLRVDRVVAEGVLAPQRTAVAGRQVADDLVAAGATGEDVVVEAADHAVVARPAVDLLHAVGAAEVVVAVAAGDVAGVGGLGDLEVVVAVGPDVLGRADAEVQALDVDDVVVLAGPAVVGAAGHREEQRLLDGQRAVEVVALDCVDAGAAVDDVGRGLAVVVGVELVVARAALEVVGARGAVDVVVAVAAVEGVVALEALELVLAAVAVERVGAVVAAQPVGAVAAVHHHGDRLDARAGRAVVTVAERHGDRLGRRAGRALALVVERAAGRHRDRRAVVVERDAAAVVGELQAEVVLLARRGGVGVVAGAVGRQARRVGGGRREGEDGRHGGGDQERGAHGRHCRGAASSPH